MQIQTLTRCSDPAHLVFPTQPKEISLIISNGTQMQIQIQIVIQIQKQIQTQTQIHNQTQMQITNIEKNDPAHLFLNPMRGIFQELSLPHLIKIEYKLGSMDVY